MLKSHENEFSLLQRALDGLAVAISWALAYLVRFVVLSGGQPGLEMLFFNLAPLIMLITIYFFGRNDLYKSQRFSSRYKEITSVFAANSEAVLGLVFLLYFLAPEKLSRIFLISYFLISMFLLILLRIMVRNILRLMRRKGRNLRHVLLIGSGEQLVDYVKTARKFKDAGLRFVGWIESQGRADELEIMHLELALEEARNKYNPDVIVVGHQNAQAHKIEEILKDSRCELTPIQILPDLTGSFIGHQIEDFAGIPLLTVNHPKLSWMDLTIKRLFDLCASGLGMLLISPLLILIALLVKLTSRGPVLYGQERMGLDGRKFQMWKFRSMRIGAEDTTGAVWATKKDSRRTPLGAFLRSTSLDELPQLWNVFVGNMSLVGPRPERPVFVEKFKDEIPAYMLRHKMKAGITGWAQVNGWRGDTDLTKRIEFDIYYIKHWSLWFDLKILFLTLWKGLINKNAY